ncbi:MAG: glycosyltransferase, partial [Thermoplasmatales archaeon]
KYIAENLPNDIDLIIAGTGSESYILNNIRRENVKILGFLDDNKLSEIISKSHLVLFPSENESSSLVSVESLAHCTPLIYKPIPENYMLQKIQFNIQANNDIDFLKGIMLKYNEYIKDKEKYISECYKLPQYLISKEEYINKFIEYFLS